MRTEQPELYAGALAYAQTPAPVSAAELARLLVGRVLDSEARTAVIPLQDWLGLGTEARMNLPATVEGNWAWRLSGDELTSALAAEIRRLVQSAQRL